MFGKESRELAGGSVAAHYMGCRNRVARIAERKVDIRDVIVPHIKEFEGRADC